MSLELNKVYLGDCLDLMNDIPSNSIDMILADLPYGSTNCRWDSIISLDKLWLHYKRIIKHNGAILLFGQTPFDKLLGCSNLEWLKYEWIWEKTQATGFLNTKKMPLKAHENILVFYKNLPTYNVIKSTGHKPINTYKKLASVQNKSEIYGKVTKDISGGGETERYPRSVLTFPSDKQRTKLDGTIHPTQKPVALCEFLIRTYSNEGDVVLDNVCGSGTVGVACKKSGRNFIMMDKEEKYVEISNKRLNNTQLITN